jgi:hypothetical protein
MHRVEIGTGILACLEFESVGLRKKKKYIYIYIYMSIKPKKIEDEKYTEHNYSIRMHHSYSHVLDIHKDFPNEVITSKP